MTYVEKLQQFTDGADYRREAQKLMDWLLPGEGDVVLDVGCGASGAFELLQETGALEFGIDPGIEQLRALRSGNTAQAFGERLPFATDSFDKLYYMHSIAHFEDPAVGMKEARRVLRESGSIVVITPNIEFERLIVPVKKVLQVAGLYVPDTTVVEHFSKLSLEELLSEEFDIQRMETFGKFGFQRIIAEATPKR